MFSGNEGHSPVHRRGGASQTIHHARMMCLTSAQSLLRSHEHSPINLGRFKRGGGGMFRARQRAMVPVHSPDFPSFSGLPGMLATSRCCAPSPSPTQSFGSSLPVNDILPGAEGARRAAVCELGTCVHDRQAMRNSTSNHSLSSAYGASTPGGRGARAPPIAFWQQSNQASTKTVHDARAAKQMPAQMNYWY